MPITERYRPQTEQDLVGNKKAISDLKGALKVRKNCILYGEPGIGKTSSVHVIAKALGYTVSETNASDERKKTDLEMLLERVRSKGFRLHVYLLDEADGLKDWKTVEKIITTSKHPVVLTANDYWKIPRKIQSLCVPIRFYRPRVKEVVARIQEIAKKEGVPKDSINFSGVGEDIRSSLQAAFYGGERRPIKDRFGKIDAILRGKKIPEELEKEDMIWLLDNLHNYYKGRDLYKALKVLAVAARSRKDALEMLPKGSGRTEYPYYLRRKKVLRSERTD